MRPQQNKFPAFPMNKVPEVTLFFWVIKMMSTTVGETAADFLNMDLNWGLTNTSLLAGTLFALILAFQLRTNRYIPAIYWSTVLLISVFGTLITDNMTDHFGVSLALSTSVFGGLLVLTYWNWYTNEKTLSIHSINSLKREAFYWVAILFTFSLGTAAGDWAAEGLGLGYLNAVIVFGALIALTAAYHYLFKANSVLCFWIAYILTRPLGASCGDLLSQPFTSGGLGLGTTRTSILFLLTITCLIVYLTYKMKLKEINR
ncbi:hypothetical protein SP99_04574 [Enterobacter sp. BIDMC92]|nr:hypothetical protein SP99_04574 [Enterobacter sp. BIDMC92]